MNRTEDGTLLFPKAFQQSKMSILLVVLSIICTTSSKLIMSNGYSIYFLNISETDESTASAPTTEAPTTEAQNCNSDENILEGMNLQLTSSAIKRYHKIINLYIFNCNKSIYYYD